MMASPIGSEIVTTTLRNRARQQARPEKRDAQQRPAGPPEEPWEGQTVQQAGAPSFRVVACAERHLQSGYAAMKC